MRAIRGGGSISVPNLDNCGLKSEMKYRMIFHSKLVNDPHAILNLTFGRVHSVSEDVL